MNLLNRLKQHFRKPEPVEVEPVQPAFVDEPPVIPTPPRQGHIIQAAKQPTYTPDTTRHGGRVVKLMPKSLKQMKQAQDKLDGNL